VKSKNGGCKKLSSERSFEERRKIFEEIFKDREPFHWRTNISYKTVSKIVAKGYDTTELVEKGYGFMDVLFLIFQGRLPKPNEAKMLDYLLGGFCEHAISPSAASARIVASGRPLINAAFAAGIMTFGMAHGPGWSHAEIMTEYLNRAEKEGKTLKEMAEILVKEHLGAKKPIMGIHQPQHVHGDPRAYAVIRKAFELGVAGKYVQFQLEIIKALEKAKGKRMHPNMVGAGDSVLLDLGFSPLAAWCIGVLARGFSCAAHAVEEMERERAWRGSFKTKMADLMSLEVQDPRISYDGPPDRPVPEKYVKCPNCGASELLSEFKACPYCGQKLK
jgi:citryl-CoA lyase